MKVNKYNTAWMLKDIPLQLWNIFMPTDETKLDELNTAIEKFKKREKVREYVMEMQKDYGLPLRPNQSIRDVEIRCRIALLRDRNKKIAP